MFKLAMNNQDASVEAIQQKGASFLAHFIAVNVLFVALAAVVAGNPVIHVLIPSLVLTGAVYAARKFAHPALIHNIIAVALMGQVALLIAALKGHAYQIDLHMYFFACLGILCILLSLMAILFATVTVALHHLLLYFFFPVYVFPTDSDLIRVVIHAVILLLEAGVLLWLVRFIIGAFASSDLSLKNAEKARLDAEAAQHQCSAIEARSAQERKQALNEVGRQFEQTVQKIIGNIRDAIGQSQTLFGEMKQLATNSSHQSQEVQSATSVSSENTTSVASATEELNASIAEISRQAQNAAGNMKGATDKVDHSKQIMARLAETSESVTGIVKVITGITGQINLLALNATIESARAGDAGKGFAVVAGEVKSLAGQTERATHQIQDSIAAMLEVCNEAVSNIDVIAESINEVNGISSAIASSVDEQSYATTEISGLVQSLSGSSQAIRQNIDSLNFANQQTAEHAESLQQMFTDLTNQANQLNGQAKDFVEKLVGA